jgi:gamma-glutamylcyclotransferase (GGCT)/AIG2-like uncharacterized protein YtfP
MSAENLNSYLYFAYGSNMNDEQMQKRCPSAKKIAIGKLKDYDIVFNRKGSYRPGGVASVHPEKNKIVYGIIWKINLLDLTKLDEIEDITAYDRKKLVIEDTNNKKHDCFVYIAKPQGTFEPDKNYFELLFSSAISANLPEEYLDRLKLLSPKN